VDIIENAQNQHQNVTGETSANYLLLTMEDMKKKGPYAKMDPPLRSFADQNRLWDALNNGAIEVIASDHAPYTKEEKEKGWSNVFDAPSGSVAVETTLPLMLDSVNKGKISLNRLVQVFSENPARINGLYPNKGGIILGADADIVIVDLKQPFKIDGANLKTIQKTTPFQGYEGEGVPVQTVLRGKLVMDEGEILNKPGFGEWVHPIK
jgi:dihydroorotase-like cyclic amidohydrolase